MDKEYYQEHKEEISEIRKEYYRKNKSKWDRRKREKAKVGDDIGAATLNMPEFFGECVEKRLKTGDPCSVFGCKHHLFTTLSKSQLLGINDNPGGDDEMIDKFFKQETCVLIAGLQGSKTLKEIGDLFWTSRERIRQIEAVALRKIRKKG